MTDTWDDGGAQIDAVIVGGGPAGLQAALTLGRMHRRVLLLDSGQYRNAAAQHMHNFITHDGDEPEQLRASARADIAAYDTVEVRGARVAGVESAGEGWRVTLVDGQEVRTRKVILATGLRDTLPDKAGLSELWGDVVAHCPFCHGHEFGGQHVAILGSGPHVTKLTMLMTPIAARITVLADGAEIDEEAASQLRKSGAEVVAEPVTGFRRSATGATVDLESGATEEVGGIFVTTELSQAASFVHDLDLEMLGSGCVRVDEFGRTSRPGIYAAGDMAHVPALPMPLASVLNAAAAGGAAASATLQELIAEDQGG